MIWRTKIWQWDGPNRFFVRHVKPHRRIDVEFNFFEVGLAENVTTGELVIHVEPRGRASDLSVADSGFAINPMQMTGRLRVVKDIKDLSDV